MNGNGAPHGNQGNGNAGRPFYHGAQQANMARGQDSEEFTANGGPRYVPPHQRAGEELDNIRPESSMSNVSNQTFATQAPMGNYSYGPSQLTSNMAAQNPFSTNNVGNGRGAQQQPYMPSQGVVYQGRGPNRGGFQGANVANRVTNNTNAPATTNNNTAIAAPTPVRRDSAAPQSRAEYLANRIKQGHADNPYDPDYGNPGPSRRPVPPPAPLPFPPQKSPGSGNGSFTPKVNGKKIAENNEGNPKAFLGNVKVVLPPWFPAAQGDKMPTLEQAFMGMPFIEACRYAVPSTAGVVKIKNIPYATSRQEVNAFLGKNTQICFQPMGSAFHAVHIIMDRHSGKTMDVFIEVTTAPEAVWVVNQFQKRVVQGRPGKIGDRPVEVELSNQDELMATLFPRTKNVKWENGVPIVDPTTETYYPGIQSTGFKGFLQDEEIVHMQKHAETPQRSPFAQRCMVRTYECMISTLHKYPWFAHEHVLISERDALFDCVHASARALIAHLRRAHHDKPDFTKPTTNTLIELTTAIFVCPGFIDAQKNAVATTLHISGFGKLTDDRALNLRFGGVEEYAAQMPFLALVKQPGVDENMVEYFGTLLTDATTGQKAFSLADIHAMSASAGKNVNKFGDLDVDYKGVKTIADAGRAELRYIEHILGKILERGGGSLLTAGTGSRSGCGSVAASRLGSVAELP